MAKQERGNAYLLERLKNEHPALYADLQAGRFPTARQALIASGLRKPPKPLNDLKRAWSNASPAEQAEFRRLIGMAGASVTTAAPTPRVAVSAHSVPSRAPSATTFGGVTASAVNIAGHLEPWARARIDDIMGARRMRMGQVMAEMGYPSLNAALGRAKGSYRPSRINTDMAVALGKWIDANKAVK